MKQHFQALNSGLQGAAIFEIMEAYEVRSTFTQAFFHRHFPKCSSKVEPKHRTLASLGLKNQRLKFVVTKTADFKGQSTREEEAAEYSEICVVISLGFLTNPICA